MYTMMMALWLALIPASMAKNIQFGYETTLEGKDKPTLILAPESAVRRIEVTIKAGAKSYSFVKKNISAGKEVRFSIPRNRKVTEAYATVRVVFKSGYVTEAEVPMEYEYGGSLEVDLSRAEADVDKKELTVFVNRRVDSADITAYGASKVVLDQRSITVDSGPGKITLPWTGEVHEVVLLDIDLQAGNTSNGFTYSPWFLDVPHQDVLFETNSSRIPVGEEWKLKQTLDELKDVLEKYGEIVPVKLYIAGCTDTVGNSRKNKTLSNDRAKSIASWLKRNGYDRPIYYYGFGESFLAVGTGDGVDEIQNRRVLYMVGANPPLPGSGVPQVRWKLLR